MTPALLSRVAPIVVSGVLAVGCGPSIDVELDLEPGPVVADQGEVTLAFVDGCPGRDPLFGCPRTMPPLATGAQARFILGSITGTPEDEARIARARVRSLDASVATVARDDAGRLVIDARAPGTTTLEIVEDGDVLDSLTIQVEAITSLAPVLYAETLLLAGAPFPANVRAFGPSGAQLYAHGAVTAVPIENVVLDTEQVGFFAHSAQLAVRADAGGEARLELRAGAVSAQALYHVVTRDQIDEVHIIDVSEVRNANKATLAATTKVDGLFVHGGPGCDWRIVQGGGPDVTLSPSVGDAFTDVWLVLYNGALVFGSGETVIECRASERVAAQLTLQLAP